MLRATVRVGFMVRDCCRVMVRNIRLRLGLKLA